MAASKKAQGKAQAARNSRGNARQQKAATAVQPQLSVIANDMLGLLIAIVALAIAVTLKMPNQAPVSRVTGEALVLLFGGYAMLVPIALLLFSLTFFLGRDELLPARVACGLTLIVIAVLSISSLLAPGIEQDIAVVLDHEILRTRGGYVGGGIAWALLSSVGREVGLVVLAGVAVAGVVVCGFSISEGVSSLRSGMGSARASLKAAHVEHVRRREELRAAREAAREAGYDDYDYDYYDDPREYDDPDEEGFDEAPTTFIGSRMRTVLTREKPEEGFAKERAAARDVPPTTKWPVGESLTSTIDGRQAAAASPAADDERPARRSSSRKRPHRRADELFAAEMEAVQEELSLDTDIPSKMGAAAAATGTPASAVDDASIPGFLSQSKRAGSEASPKSGTRRTSSKRTKKRTTKKATEAQQVADASVTVRTASWRPGDEDDSYTLPPFSMLTSNPQSAQSASSKAELDQTMAKLQGTLHEFGLSSRVVDYVSGPLVTTFRVEMGEGERVNKIRNLEDDIALTLAAEKVRIFAPIAGTSYVGIEIPNKTRQNVHLGDVLPSAMGGPLEVAIGRDSSGKPVIADIAKMPHMLVAGTTGSGKSVLINSMIMSLLMRTTPKQLRLIMVDPKRVEFKGYNGIPHLYVPVVTEPRQAASALQWAVSEMERRLKVFEKASARNITTYNEMCLSGKLADMKHPPEPMPYLVIVIDELADLMMVAGKDVEASIVRIAQLARAAGIHLVIATQRPSANVVTGLIKSNIDSRVALKVSSGIDSRVILDETGADRLLGNGDMLFKDRGLAPKRVLGCYSSDPEIEAVVDFIRGQAEPDYHEEILSAVVPGQPGGGGGVAEEDDPLIWEAAQIVVESQLGSTSGLQRRLKVGYARAGRIMDMLEAKGVVGPSAGSKPREVLLDEEGLEELRVLEEKYREV